MASRGDGYGVPIATGKTGVGISVGVGVNVKVGVTAATVPVWLLAVTVGVGPAFDTEEVEHELRKNKPRTRKIVMAFIFAPFGRKTLNQLAFVIRVLE